MNVTADVWLEYLCMCVCLSASVCVHLCVFHRKQVLSCFRSVLTDPWLLVKGSFCVESSLCRIENEEPVWTCSFPVTGLYHVTISLLR